MKTVEKKSAEVISVLLLCFLIFFGGGEPADGNITTYLKHILPVVILCLFSLLVLAVMHKVRHEPSLSAQDIIDGRTQRL